MNLQESHKGSFLVPSRNEKIYQLAQTYLERCDEFDRKVCTAESFGIPVPACIYESHKVSEHARSVMLELLIAGAEFEITRAEMILAVSNLLEPSNGVLQ
jgi:hypothetical protein